MVVGRAETAVPVAHHVDVLAGDAGPGPAHRHRDGGAGGVPGVGDRVETVEEVGGRPADKAGPGPNDGAVRADGDAFASTGRIVRHDGPGPQASGAGRGGRRGGDGGGGAAGGAGGRGGD